MSTPKEKRDEFINSLTPEMWKTIERDVVTRLHLLQTACESVRDEKTNSEEKEDLKELMVRTLALLSEFTKCVNEDGPWIIIEGPIRWKKPGGKWSRN